MPAAPGGRPIGIAHAVYSVTASAYLVGTHGVSKDMKTKSDTQTKNNQNNRIRENPHVTLDLS